MEVMLMRDYEQLRLLYMPCGARIAIYQGAQRGRRSKMITFRKAVCLPIQLPTFPNTLAPQHANPRSKSTQSFTPD